MMIIDFVQDWNLWQVSIISNDALAAGGRPEEIFLLENVEQILTGIDRRIENQGHKSNHLFSMMQQLKIKGCSTPRSKAGPAETHHERHFVLFIIKKATKRQYQYVYCYLPSLTERSNFCQAIAEI